MQEKQSGNENNKMEYFQENTYIESGYNKSKGESAIKQKENASKQTEMCASSTNLNNSYLNNLPLLSTLLGIYTSYKLVTQQLAHTTYDGVETISFSIITEGPQ